MTRIEPTATVEVPTELLQRAVNLRALAWNLLTKAPVGSPSPDWAGFWRKLDALRLEVNEEGHEDLRILMVKGLTGQADQRATRHTMGRDYRIEHEHLDGTDCSGRPLR